MMKSGEKMTPSWQLVRPSISLARKNSETVILIVLLPTLLAALALQLITVPAGSDELRISVKSLAGYGNNSTGLIILALAGIWQLINLPVSYYLQATASAGKVPTVRECYQRGLAKWPRLIGFEIIFIIMTIIGLVLAIVPGLIVITRYYMTPFYIVKDNLSIRAAMKKSAAQSRPIWGYIWGIIGVTLAFGLVASVFARIPLLGAVLAAFIGLIYLFGPALRWQEVRIVKLAGKK